MSKVLRMPKRVLNQREVWRSELRKFSLEELIDVLEARFLNDIDIAGRVRDKESTKMPIASDTFSEFSYKEMRVVDAAIKYLAELLQPAGVLVRNVRREVISGPMSVVTTDAIATSMNGRKLRSADLTKVRALLRNARRRREERAA